MNMIQTIRTIGIGILTCLTSACSSVDLLNRSIPRSSFHLSADIAYGPTSRQVLDIYVPTKRSTDMPVVIFYYGGSWDSGSKKDYLFAAEAFAASGFVTVVPDYRVYPEVKFPALMDDPVQAAKWVVDHIQKFGGDPRRVYLAGHSAGAHLAVMMSVNPYYLNQVGLRPADFRGTIGLAGPYDFLPLKSARLMEIFGPEEMRWQSQPIAFVDGKNPPMLLLTGMRDHIVWPTNSIHLTEKIQQHQGQVDLIRYPEYGHVDLVAKLAKPFRGNSPMLNDILNFIHAHP
jgi:acetyl esterase/lipase